MMKVYYCNLCGARCEYKKGSMPRICSGCEAVKHRLYYKYEKRPPDSFPSGNKIKQLCLERDRCKCIECGSSERLDVHHKDGNSWRKIGRLANNNLENLITLCHSCHMNHHIKKKERTLKMIAYHNEHPEVRQAALARMFGLSRERVGQILGRVRENNSCAS